MLMPHIHTINVMCVWFCCCLLSFAFCRAQYDDTTICLNELPFCGIQLYFSVLLSYFFFVFFFCCRRRRLVCMYFICSTRTYRMFLFVFILHISSVCVAFYVTSLVLLFNELISSIWIRLCALCMYECDCFFFVCAFVSSLVPNKKVAQKKCSINYLCSMLAFCIAFFSSVFIQSH